MKQLQNADSDSTMAATLAFETIIEQVKLSNLNFHLQLFPFSAVISLKKLRDALQGRRVSILLQLYITMQNSVLLI